MQQYSLSKIIQRQIQSEMEGSNLIVMVLCIVLLGAPMGLSEVDEWHSNGYGVGTEKVTRLHFYHHETSSGDKPTVLTMAEAPTTKNSPSFFGLFGMTDNPLTEGPEPTSKYLGQAQGMLASSSQEEFTLVIAVNFVFKGGEFSGSSLSVLGRNPFLHEVREMPIVGGTGAFRFARGFAQVKTYWANITSHDLIEEYHMTVMHY